LSVSKADGAKGMETMTESRTRVFVLAAASLGLTGGIFFLDLLTPLGIPVWICYLAPILLWSLTPSGLSLYVLACLCSVMNGLGLYLSPHGAPVILRRPTACLLSVFSSLLHTLRWRRPMYDRMRRFASDEVSR
jgi:hypothetical protein